MTAVNVLMIFPAFIQNSFWSLRPVCEIYGARCPAPPLGMLTLAALLPKHWNVKLIDRNAEELDPAAIDWADLVMTGGMLPQRDDTLEVIRIVHGRGKPVAVGGPDPTSCPEAYETADLRVVGEAEGIIAEFVAAWESGTRTGQFTAPKFQADVTKSPIPRFDLINFRNYLYIGLQFSRGCPFNCEFCDIIELYGRVPRSKTTPQMLAELQALFDAGYRGHVDFVDDNLIGNKKALKLFLPDLIKWQEQRGYPFNFSTEASMNLADDSQLLHMLADAGFFAIFTGIESPDAATLIATQKKQNTRRSLAESVHKIYDAGIFVIAGFIIGFDTEHDQIAQGMISCIEDTSIPVSMVGLLTALPNTQLTRRLQAEGRLLDFTAGGGDQCTAGLNFITKRPKRDIFQDYQTVIDRIYEPEAFFARVRTVAVALKPKSHPGKFDWRQAGLESVFLLRLFWTMTFVHTEARGAFWRTIAFSPRHNLRAFEAVIRLSAFYLHLGPFARRVSRELQARMETECLAEADATSAPVQPALAGAV